jgi:Chaperone of endosialidase
MVPGSARNWIPVNAVHQSNLNKKMKTKNMTTLPMVNSITRSPLRRGLLLITVALACFGLSPVPKAFAVTPAPDGGYPNGNTAEGQNALFSLTTGIKNTAVGFDALLHNTTGNDNTAYGYEALYSNTSSFNTANGYQALFKNTTSSFNTANGYQALYRNTAGYNNTANGYQALYRNTTGGFNTANGSSALEGNTTGSFNTANGYDALFLTTGNGNTAIGSEALSNNTTGTYNTANGEEALFNNTIGWFNIALGYFAGYNLIRGSYNIDIGNPSVERESRTIRIGIEETQTATFIAGITGTGVTGTTVVVNSSGQLAVAPSSQRFKDEIKPMDKASEAILALKPVTFRYKQNIDPKGIPQFGLVAEEVEKVNPDLVARDAQGKPTPCATKR